MRPAVKISIAIAAALFAIFFLLVLRSCEWGTCTHGELAGAWQSPDGKMRLRLDAGGNYSMDFENQRHQWAHAAGTWEFDILSDGDGHLFLHGFPAQERFYFDRFSPYENHVGSSTKIVAPYVGRRLLSGACIIGFDSDVGIWLEKTGSTP